MGKKTLGFDAMCWIWAGKRRLVPGGQLVLLFTGPGSGHGGQVVHWAHAVNGSVKLLQLLANAVKLLWVWCQVAGICLASLAPPLFAWTKDKRVNSNPDDHHLSFSSCKPTTVIQIPHTDGAVLQSYLLQVHHGSNIIGQNHQSQSCALCSESMSCPVVPFDGSAGCFSCGLLLFYLHD